MIGFKEYVELCPPEIHSNLMKNAFVARSLIPIFKTFLVNEVSIVYAKCQKVAV